MRDDLPTPIRRDLDKQRRDFLRMLGTGVEGLISMHVDPAPWMAATVASLQAYAAAQEPSHTVPSDQAA